MTALPDGDWSVNPVEELDLHGMATGAFVGLLAEEALPALDKGEGFVLRFAHDAFRI